MRHEQWTSASGWAGGAGTGHCSPAHRPRDNRRRPQPRAQNNKIYLQRDSMCDVLPTCKTSASPFLFLLACGLGVFRRSDSVKSAHKDSLNEEHHLSMEQMLPSKVTYVLCFPVAILNSIIPFCCHDNRIEKSSMLQVHVRQLVWLIFRR
jgi:hypothetical protein